MSKNSAISPGKEHYPQTNTKKLHIIITMIGGKLIIIIIIIIISYSQGWNSFLFGREKEAT